MCYFGPSSQFVLEPSPSFTFSPVATAKSVVSIMDPLTPKNQASFHESVKPPASPTKSKSPDAGIEKRNNICANIGFFNNRDMFVCAPGPFLKQYGPRDIDDATVTQCMDRMTQGEGAVMFRDKNGIYGWVKFRTLPKDSGVHEDKTFKPLGDIIEAVLVDKTNDIHFRLAPNTEISSDICGSTHKIDGAFLEIEFLGSPLSSRIIRGPIELKKYRHKWIRAVAHLQMLGACHHILNEDARRMWVYGLTFENNLASIWYFSRSHSVKSITFNWITDPRLLVKILLAFAQATPQELGVDPTVHLGPAGKNGKDVSFVYEVPGGNAGPLFFKTGKSRVSQRPMCIAGRATRVWEVTQVTAADGKEEVSGKKLILKDVWLDDSDDHSKTEAENMDAIFEAVDLMVKDGLDAEIALELESNPKATSEALLSDAVTVARLTMQFIKRHKCFTAFDEAAKQRLCDNFINKKYRSLFLTKRHAWKGLPSKAVAEGAFRVYNFFHPKPLDVKAIEEELEEEYANSRGLGLPSSSLRTLTSALDGIQLDQDDEDDQSRRFAPKRQSRFIYEEVCTTLENLQTVGEVVDVLCQTVDALHILYVVGWVHRDVSVGNILAYRSSEDQPWTMKLADLEFAQKMIDPARPPRSDPRTGTPFFMPVEIASKRYLFKRYFRAEVPEPDPYGVGNLAIEMGVADEDDPQAYQILSRVQHFPIPVHKIIVPAKPFWDRVPADVATVNHNFQHDLESVFWIFVFIVSSRVGCKASSEQATEYFKYDIKRHFGRRDLMRGPMSELLDTLDSKLRPLHNLMGHLQRSLFEHYITRPMFGHLGVEESYSSIHAIFATTLRTIQSKEGPWKAMELVHKSSISDEKSVVPQIVIGKRTRDTRDDDERARNATRFKAGGEN